MILGKNLGKGRRIGSEDLFFREHDFGEKNWERGDELEVKTFFLGNTMILGKNWESGDLFFSDDFVFIY